MFAACDILSLRAIFIVKCIVTAGPTYEELDEVRRLTNFSTGALGTELANFLTDQGHNVELLRGYYSVCRVEPRAQRTQVFTTTNDLQERLRKLGTTRAVAVFHAAAVSDFTFGGIWTRPDGGGLKEIHAAKIPTRGGSVFAELKPAPKIIAELRSWYPAAFIAGWKYELEPGRTEAIARAAGQVADCQTGLCVLNGRAYGRGFGLVTGPDQCRHVANKKALFEALLESVRAWSVVSAPMPHALRSTRSDARDAPRSRRPYCSLKGRSETTV
jgi:hypothetical protein